MILVKYVKHCGATTYRPGVRWADQNTSLVDCWPWICWLAVRKGSVLPNIRLLREHMLREAADIRLLTS